MRILTFDLEDWFHILDHPATERPEQWNQFESRIERNVDRVLQMLEAHEQTSTWFCLGWMTKNHPEVVKRISRSHEIACHSDSHQLVYKQSRSEFKADTLSAIQRLEDLTGKKITTYRASGFSITRQTPWAFEVLAECGITTDCSVFPASRNHGGFPEFGSAVPCRIMSQGIQLKEFPLNVRRFYGMNVVFSGGGYFRLLPYSLIKKMTAQSEYVMTYFHPRDFDPEQPMIRSLPLHRKFMSYYGLKNTGRKFNQWIRDFKFTDLQTADKMMDWDQTKIIHL